jgi:hypothetical protein
MYAYKLETQISSDHRISIELPADFPEGGAEVIVLTKDAPTSARVPDESMAKLVAWLRSLPPSHRSPEDFEAQIQEERNAWGD